MKEKTVAALGLAVRLGAPLAAPLAAADPPSSLARRTADQAPATYGEALVETLGDLITFQTVHRPGLANAENPRFQAMTTYLRDKAQALGLGFEDHGAVVVVSLGEGDRRLGIVTHGDVQPADASKWARDPFTLDRQSEPGRLVGRGVEDDKGPIATALYAMKAVKDQGVALKRRIELIISYTEESDWQPFQAFLEAHPPPQLNVAIDAEYPVVVAEKGWCLIEWRIPEVSGPAEGPRLASLSGGAFVSQIPEDAVAVIQAPTPEMETTLLDAARRDPEIVYRFIPLRGHLRIEAQGIAAHSSKPWNGKNAITHLAGLLGRWSWPDSQASRMVRWINDLVGQGHEGELFGNVGYEHPFMGPLTLSLTTLQEDGEDLVARVNMRRPAGRSGPEVEASVEAAVDAWRRRTGFISGELRTRIGDPYFPRGAPQVETLLGIFEHYTGQTEAEALSIGGGTHARLVPNGVNFGPAMPGEPYTGHSEHEFMSHDQLMLNLKMYTAMLVELAAGPGSGPSAPEAP